MRLVGHTASQMFSRHDPARARAVAIELVQSTSPFATLDDPVRTWDMALQVDRGLGAARRLHRVMNSPAWHSEHDSPADDQGPVPADGAADYLFVAVMNLVYQMPLSDEAHLFRLWYLATRAVNPSGNAMRVFGHLRHLPPHLQLAAGARVMETLMASGHAERGALPAPAIPPAAASPPALY